VEPYGTFSKHWAYYVISQYIGCELFVYFLLTFSVIFFQIRLYFPALLRNKHSLIA